MTHTTFRPVLLSIVSAIFLATSLLVTGGSCVCAANLTEPEVLAYMADNAVLPSLSKTAQTAAQLEKAVQELCSNPDDRHLEQARVAWKNAYLSWCHSAPFLLGSAAATTKRIGNWPVNPVVLDAAVQRKDLAHMLEQPDARGFAGAEHLLFAPKNAALATADLRCAHLADITREIAELTARVEQNWQTDAGRKFKSAGDGKPFLLPGDALSLLLARVLNVTETLLRDRIAVTSNFFEAPSRPDNLEAWESGSSVAAFKACVAGIRKALAGDNRTGLTRLVATKDGMYESKDPALAKDIHRQLDKIDKDLNKLENSRLDLHTRIKEDPDTLEKLYTHINTLQEQLVEASLVLELDVRSAVEIQLTE